MSGEHKASDLSKAGAHIATGHCSCFLHCRNADPPTFHREARSPLAEFGGLSCLRKELLSESLSLKPPWRATPWTRCHTTNARALVHHQRRFVLSSGGNTSGCHRFFSEHVTPVHCSLNQGRVSNFLRCSEASC